MFLRFFDFFFFSSRRRHTRLQGDWSSDVCSSDLPYVRQHTEAATPVLNVLSGFFPFGKQAIGLPLDYRVALAHALFQLRPVDHLDMTAIVLNQSRRLQLPSGLRNALAAHSEHVRDQFLGHVELARWQP